MKRWVCILLLGCGWTIGRAQTQQFSLDSCIEYAWSHRTEIKISENTGADVRRSKGYARQQQLPDLGASWSHEMNWGRSLNTEKYEWEDSKNQYGNMSLSSSLTLFAGLKLRNQIRATRLNMARHMTTHQKLKNDIRLEVIQAFYEVLAAEARWKLTEVFYQADLRQEEKVSIMDSMRRIAAPDRLEIVAQTRKALVEKKNAEKQYQFALLKLRKCMNYREEKEIQLTQEELVRTVATPQVKEIYVRAIRNSPEIKSQYWDSLLLQNQLRQLRGNFSPVLALGGTLYTRYQNHLTDPVSGDSYAFWKQLKDKNYKQVGISLSIPLFNRSTIRRQIREVKTDMLNLSLNSCELLNDIWDEMEEICLEVKIRKENCRELEEQEKNYQEIYRLREIQFNRGKLSVYDLLTAETNWRNVQMNLLLERFNLLCYLDMIKVYVGD